MNTIFDMIHPDLKVANERTTSSGFQESLMANWTTCKRFGFYLKSCECLSGKSSHISIIHDTL